MYDLTSIWLILPLIIIGLGSCTVLIMGTIKQVSGKSNLFYTTIFILLFTFIELLLRFHAPFSLEFSHSFQFDDEATLFKMAIVSTIALLLIYARTSLETFKIQLSETYSLILLSCMGMMLLTSAMNMVTVFLGIELMSLPLYALVAIYRDNKKSTEAALKYFAMGAFSSGLILFGFAWLYGATGTMDFSEIPALLPAANHSWLLLAQIFIVAGIAFKFGLMPFHMWVPDVYEAAPAPITALVATAPKIALVAFTIHFFQVFDNVSVNLKQMFLILSLISVILGNIIALAQTNIRRMLAYSSIGHMGIIFLGLINFNNLAVQSVIFYIVTYALTTLLIFSVLIQLKVNYQEVSNISDLSGVSKNYPWHAFAVMMSMFSLAGVPPLLGFMAKFMILESILNSHKYLFALIMVLSSVIGAVYYIRVIKVAFFSNEGKNAILLSTKLSDMVLKANSLLILVLGLIPSILLYLVKSVFT